MAETNNRKSKIVTSAVVVFLCIVFAVGFVYGLNSVLAMEGAYPPETDTHGVYSEPQSKEEVINFLKTVLTDAAEQKPKTTVYDDFSIDGGSLKITGSEELKKTVLFAKDSFTGALAGATPQIDTDFSEVFPVDIPSFGADAVKSYECKYFARSFVYQCEKCGAENSELLNGCPECGSPNLYVQRGRPEYIVTIVLNTDDEVINEFFPERTDGEIRSLFGEGFGDNLEIGQIGITNDNLEVYFTVNRESGELTYLEYKKDMTVKTEAVFKGNLASLGSTDIEFTLTEKLASRLTWPALTLSADELIIEPKKTDHLTATLTCSNPLEAAVIWETSDENIVTVDEDGYLKAGKEPGEAVITASFEFLGKTYKDTCKVLVKIPVESMAISKRSIKLEVGQTKELSANVSPKDASIQTKTWYSEDERIATVDENGVVTAVGSGVVTVYALSDDGYFKSSCEVTVK